MGFIYFFHPNLEFGTVIHRVLGEFYQARMTGDRMPLNDVHSLFEEYWRIVAELNDEIRYSNGKDFQTLLISGIDLLTAWYHKLPDDNFRVISVEEAFSFNIKDLPTAHYRGNGSHRRGRIGDHHHNGLEDIRQGIRHR